MDVTNSTVQLNTADGKMAAYVAQPKAAGNYPGVVVIQEAFGVNDHINSYAGHGFFCDDRPASYNEAAAKDAWEKTKAFFAQHLK